MYVHCASKHTTNSIFSRTALTLDLQQRLCLCQLEHLMVGGAPHLQDSTAQHGMTQHGIAWHATAYVAAQANSKAAHKMMLSNCVHHIELALS